MSRLTLVTGVKTYEIEDENGKHLCDIRINTTDLNVMTRILNMEDKIKKIMPEVNEPKTDDEAIEFMKSPVMMETDKKIREIIDEAFDSDICSGLFGNTNCLSVSASGATLVERFLDMIAPAIANDYQEAMKASSNRISKYTNQVK